MDKRSIPQDAQLPEIIDRITSGLCTAIPGVIESFDSATCLSTVRSAVRMKTVSYQNGLSVNYLDQPLIERVPVVLPHSVGAGLFLTVPIKEGDQCLIVFGYRSIDNVVEFGGVQNPCEPNGIHPSFTDLRHHDMTDAICIPSMLCESSSIENWSQTAIEIRNQDGTVKVSVEDGQIIVNSGTNVRLTIKGNEVTLLTPVLKLTGNVEVTGTVKETVDSIAGIVGSQVSLYSHTHDPITGLPVKT